jgi:hypothetical protein
VYEDKMVDESGVEGMGIIFTFFFLEWV